MPTPWSCTDSRTLSRSSTRQLGEPADVVSIWLVPAASLFSASTGAHGRQGGAGRKGDAGVLVGPRVRLEDLGCEHGLDRSVRFLAG